MASSSPRTLVKRNSDTALMPPPPPPKRIRRPSKVLDEDTYTDALSQIIARDFFPGLAETQSQQDYLSALESRNSEWIVDAGRRLTEVMTPRPYGTRGASSRLRSTTPSMRRASQTPTDWRGTTPSSVAISDATGSEDKGRKEPNVNVDMSLAAFQAKYTSEDNESFNSLLDKQNVKRAEKYKWLWANNRLPSKQQIAQDAQRLKLLQASSHGEAFHNTNKDLALRQSPNAASRKEDRPAMINIKQAKPKNAVMFAPDSIEDTHQTTFQASEASSYVGPRMTLYQNTRLPPPSILADTVPPSPSLSAVNDAIAGCPRWSASEIEVGYGGSETPKLNGYAFVDAEPTPSELGMPVEEEPIPETDLLERFGITAEKGTNPFTINQASKWEDLHHRMVEKNNRSQRCGANSRLEALKGSKADTPKFLSSPKIGSNAVTAKRRTEFSPAGERLLSRLGKTPAEDGFGEGKRSGLSQRWTPTPKTKNKQG